MSEPIRVVVADDDPVVLGNIVKTLSRAPEIELVGQVGSGAEVLALLEREQVDVALMDVVMPNMDGVSAAAAIRKQFPETAVVLLTGQATTEALLGALAAGVGGFATKEADQARIVELIRRAHAGEVVMGPWPLRQMGAAYAKVHRNRDTGFRQRLEALPRHQRKVLDELIRGSTNPSIASRLGQSPETIKKYVSNMLTSTGCNSRSELAVRAVSAGYEPAPREVDGGAV